MSLPTIEVQDLGREFEDNPAAWLVAQAAQRRVTIVLAHADDGIIWGRVEGPTLLTSHALIPDVSPRLRLETLQQLRLFGPAGEWLVWRDDTAWRARWVGGDEWERCHHVDEDQILWGTQAEQQKDGFTVFVEGQQGFRHAPPLLAPDENYGQTRELRLKVRHYVDYNDDGEARIVVSRLVEVFLKQTQGGEDALAAA